MEREALKLALEALETCYEDEWHSEDDFGLAQTYDENKVAPAIAAIKAALAQPAQELVKYKCTVIDDQHPQGIPLEQWGNTGKAQRPWVDLTPKDLNEIFAVARTGEHAVNLAADKLKEKNT